MDAIELLTKDHRDVEQLFAEFTSSSGDERAHILGELIRELSIHSALEEAYLYPRIADEAPNGEELVAESEREHQRVKEILARLDGKLDKAHTKEVASEVETLQKNVEHHVHEEETEVFPAFESATTKRELADIGRQLRDAKSSAPTRPHPQQPSANALTAWANGLIDHARDAVTGRRG